MRGPMLVLAALCLGVGLAAGFVVRFMEPVVAMVSGIAPDPVWAVTATSAGWLFPISFGVALMLLIAWALVLAAIRRRLLAGRPTHETVTWDCGYAAPAPSMQYTATGFAQPLTHGAQAILRPRGARHPPQGVFPVSASFHSETPDAARERLFGPLFIGIANLLGRLRWLQHGQVHLYILYIVVALMVLLAWALRS